MEPTLYAQKLREQHATRRREQGLPAKVSVPAPARTPLLTAPSVAPRADLDEAIDQAVLLATAVIELHRRWQDARTELARRAGIDHRPA